MDLTVAAAAARAAAAAARGLGVDFAETVILADGANVIVHLSPSPVVAKVAGSTPAVRDAAAGLQRELDLVLFLAGAGAPVMEPSPEVPATVCHRDGRVMSFWTYVERSGTGTADEATIGSMLRDLHAVLRACPDLPPLLAPLADIPAFLARPRTRLAPADAAILAAAHRRLTGELARAGRPAQALHGDAGAGNLMPAGGRWLWHDFEDTCSGPVEWDLAASTARAYRDRDLILAAYGEKPDAEVLRTCEQLRRLHLTIWYSLYAERLPDCRQRAAELVTSWRGGRDG